MTILVIMTPFLVQKYIFQFVKNILFSNKLEYFTLHNLSKKYDIRHKVLKQLSWIYKRI